MKKLNPLVTAVLGVALVSSVAGGLWAAEAAVTRATARATTRVDPVAVVVVPVVTTPVVTAPTVTDDEAAAAAAAVRPTRPPIIDTRSAGRPAPITPIPR